MQPGVYSRGIIEDIGLSFDQQMAGFPWIVFSDRSPNQTFSDPGPNGTPLTQLGFMEWYIVVDRSGDYLRLAKQDRIPKNQTLDSDVKDYGWIKYNRLLLWKRCLVSDNHINRKAMILNTMDVFNERQATGALDDQSIDFKLSPGVNMSSSNFKATLFEFFYVYKEVEVGNQKYCLLSVNPELPGDISDAGNVVKGWVQKSRMTLWNHRIAIEPNWDLPAAIERSQGFPAMFFIDQPSAELYGSGTRPSMATTVWKSDPLQTRPGGQWRRFPLLERNIDPITGESTGVIKAGVMGEVILRSVNNSSDTLHIDPILLEEYKRLLNSMIAKRRNINIVFVVDGTLSMEPYYPMIERGVHEAELALNNTQNQINYAAVIYRDYEEEFAEWRNICTLSQGGALTWIQDKSYHNTNTSTAERPYYGLQGAVRGVGLTPSERNIIILIGDAGNHHEETKVNLQTLINDMADLQCSFLAIQVHKGTHDSYEDFPQQMKDLAWDVNSNLLNKHMDYGNRLGFNFTPEWTQVAVNKHVLQNGIMAAWVVESQPGIMQPSQLAELIETFIQRADEHNDWLIQVIKDMILGRVVLDDLVSADSNPVLDPNSFVFPMAGSFLQFLQSSGLDSTHLDLMKKEKFQIYVEAWAPDFIDDQEYSVFKRVLLMSTEELSDLRIVMRELKYSSGDVRQHLYDVALSVLGNFTGEEDVQILEEMTYGDLNELVFGMPSRTGFLSEVRIGDIREPNLVSDDEIASWTAIVNTAYDTIRRIQSDESFERKFYSDEQIYYWIDEDILP